MRVGLAVHGFCHFVAIENVEFFDHFNFPRSQASACKPDELADLSKCDGIDTEAAGRAAALQTAERAPEVAQRARKWREGKEGFVFGDLFRSSRPSEKPFVEFAARDAALRYLFGRRQKEIALRVVPQVFTEAAIKDAWSPRYSVICMK